MSRAVVLDSLRADTALAELVPSGNIIANPMGDGRPPDLNPGNFVVLRWGDQDWDPAVKRGPFNLVVWAHSPRIKIDSYNEVDSILEIITQNISKLEDTDGLDNWHLTTAMPSGGWSGDLVDPAYDTIAKNAPFKILTHRI